MDHSNSSTAQLDLYLGEIKGRQKKLRRRRWIIFLVALLLISGGVAYTYFFVHHPQEIVYRNYSSQQLNPERVSQLLMESNHPIIVHSESHQFTDTIRQNVDYQSFLDEVTKLETVQEVASAEGLSYLDSLSFAIIQEQEVEISPSEEVPSAPIRLMVNGEKIVGEFLEFIVENYREEWSYQIEYGNGQRNRIQKMRKYAYPRAGRFTAILRAIDPSGEVHEYPFYMEIFDGATSTKEFEAIDRVEGDRGGKAGEVLFARESEDSDEFETFFANNSVPNPEKIIRPSADIMPSFPGGVEKLRSYLKNNIQYPPTAIEKRIEGNVKLHFVVWEDGSIGNISVIESVSEACDAEALRVMRNMPAWQAGIEDGEEVPVFSRLSIKFTLVDKP